jgi:hypothetical protein
VLDALAVALERHIGQAARAVMRARFAFGDNSEVPEAGRASIRLSSPGQGFEFDRWARRRPDAADQASADAAPAAPVEDWAVVDGA